MDDITIISPKKQKPLSKRAMKLSEAIMQGKPYKEALAYAGYSPKSVEIIRTVKKKIKEFRDGPQPPEPKFTKEEQIRIIEKGAMTKEEITTELRDIALHSQNEKNRIAAMQQICRMLGYDAPTKIDQNSSQNLVMRIELDKSEQPSE